MDRLPLEIIDMKDSESFGEVVGRHYLNERNSPIAYLS
jgi:hypothetical protein